MESDQRMEKFIKDAQMALAKPMPTSEVRRKHQLRMFTSLLDRVCQFERTDAIEKIEEELLCKVEELEKPGEPDDDNQSNASDGTRSDVSVMTEDIGLPVALDVNIEPKMKEFKELWFEMKLVEDTLAGLRGNLANVRYEEAELKSKLLELCGEMPIGKTKIQEAVRSAYESWLSQLQSAFSALKKASSALPSNYLQQQRVQTSVKEVASTQDKKENLSQKLPPRDLPDFSGRFVDWPEFYDELTTLLDNKLYTIKHRFQRLSTALKDDFCQRIIAKYRKNHDLEGAINALKDHFENPLRVMRDMREMVDNIVPLNNLKGEPTTEQWQRFYGNVVEVQAQAEVCSADPSVRQDMVEKLYRKLPEMHRVVLNGQPTATLDSFVAYVERNWNTSLAYQGQKEEKKPLQPAKSQQFRRRGQLQMAAITITDYRNGCVFCCTSTHRSEACRKYSEPRRRHERLTSLKICRRCLTNSNPHQGCTAPACAKCGRDNHHTLICFARNQPNFQANGQANFQSNIPQPVNQVRNVSMMPSAPQLPQAMPAFAVPSTSSAGQVFQQHANQADVNMAAMRIMSQDQIERYRGIHVRQVIWLYARSGNRRQKVRVFLDGGSQPTVIIRKTYEKLYGDELLAPATRFIGPGESSSLSSRCEFFLENEDGTTSLLIQAWLKDDLDKVGVERVPSDLLGIANELGVDVPDEDQDAFIPDIVIGAEHIGYPEFTITEYRKVTHTVTAYKCEFGWSLIGFYKRQGNELPGYPNTLSMAAMSIEPERPCNICPVSTLREVFGIEDDDETCPLKQVEIRYDETEKRYFIKLPWASKKRPPNNFYNAMCQIKALKSKLKNQGVLEDYDAAIQELITSGQAERAEQRFCQDGFYLPHRPVIRETAKKTRVRPVFNASSAVKKSWSLNDCLARGRPLNCDLRQSLVNFRTSPVPLVTDIVRAFLQIRVEPMDRDYLRFLWYENLNDEEPTVYRMTSVLFGAVCSPHILGAVLQKLFEDNRDKFESLQETNISIYMDDLFLDVDSPEKVKEVMAHMQQLLAIGSFALHDWTTTESIAQAHQDLPFQQSETTKCLGLEWQPEADDLVVKVDATPPPIEGLTRRQAVSFLARLYDPLDWLLPFKVKIRWLSRRMSQVSSNWDDPLPEDLKKEFCVLIQEYQNIQLLIPRNVASNPSKLMIFCDASPEAYGAVAYLLDEDDQFTLLAAKGKLAPAKPQTIPKLELNAAAMGAKLLEQLRKSPRLQELPCDLFSDSQITLWRIFNEKRQFDDYVQTRLETIRSANARWRYVETDNNPADLLTHAKSLDELMNAKLWWHGPDLVQLNNPAKKFDPSMVSDVTLREFLQAAETRKIVQCAAMRTAEPQEEYQLRQHWHETLAKPYTEALRLVTDQLRAKEVSGTKTMEKRNQNKTNQYDLETYARLKLWRAVQRATFPSDYLNLCKKKSPTDRRLRNSQAKIDEWGVIRTRRRLPKCYSFSVKFPLILADHALVRSYIVAEHVRLCHPGINHTYSAIVGHFHLFKGKSIVRNLLSHCRECNIERGLPFEAPHADLPLDRATMAEGPFVSAGLDFFGPIATSNNQKIYGLIFSCSRTRAVHLEPVTSMSLESCLLAIKRFISRRGVPRELRSDNAPTFRAANNLLAKLIALVKEAVKDASIQGLGIKWSFGAPRAPWWGGHYERLIGVIKKRLTHILWRMNLRLEVIWTALAEVEAIVNSRPLGQVDTDGTLLTPGHFLTGRQMLAVPFAAIAVDEPLIAQYFKWQALMNEFWEKWSSEYLLTLRNLSSLKKSRTPEIGETVLIEDKPKKRRDWPLAKIVELHPGEDGVVRHVVVETPDGVRYPRAIQSLVPLEATACAPRPPGTVSDSKEPSSV